MLGLGSSITSGNFFSKNYLLDDVSDAVGAYSLRKLRLNYTGPAIRVRRTSDDAEKDIYFTADGTLDVSTLESFCSGTDGRVSRWYNQVEGEPTTLGDKSFGSNIYASYSVRKLDEAYTGPCMSVVGESGTVGAEYDQNRSVGLWMNRILTETYTHFSSAEAGTQSFEIFVDTPGVGTGNVLIGTRFGYKSETSGERGIQYYVGVPQKTWTKVSFDANDANAAGDTKLSSQRVEVWLSGGDSAKYKTGDKFLVRNVKSTAPSFVEHSYDDTSTGWRVQPGQDTKFIDSYDVGFDASGELDREKIVAFGKETYCNVIKIEVDADLGDTSAAVGVRKELPDIGTGARGALGNQYTVQDGDMRIQFDIFANCPSIGSGSGDVEIDAQIGINTADASPNMLTQNTWTSVVLEKSSNQDDNFHIYIAGSETNGNTPHPDQVLADGDIFYIKNVYAKHTRGGTYESDFSSGVDGFTERNETSDFTLSQERKEFALHPSPVRVACWYDQSGNGFDAKQNTFLDMPLIYDYDEKKGRYAVYEESDKPALHYRGPHHFDHIQSGVSGNTSTGLTFFSVTRHLGTQTNSKTIFGLYPDGSQLTVSTTYTDGDGVSQTRTGINEVYELFEASSGGRPESKAIGQYYFLNNNALYQVLGSGNIVRDTNNVHEVVLKQDRTYSAKVNGANEDTSGHSSLDGANLNSVPLHCGYDEIRFYRRNNDPGLVQEMVFWQEDKSDADRLAIRENMNDYYRAYSAGDAIQTVIDDQPKIVSSGTVEKVGDVPVLAMVNSFLDASENENLKTTTLDAYIYLQGSDVGYLLFTASDGGGDYSFALQKNGGDDVLVNDYGTPNLYANNVEFEYVNGTTTRDALYIATNTRAAALTTGSVEVHEGADVDSWTPGSPATFTFLINGYDSGNGGYYEYSGKIGELIFFDADKSSDRQFIQDSMQKHFKVKPFDAPLSQSYGSGAKTAYSLRKVNDSYGGPAIRVRNQYTDVERDIYFDSFGNLDIADLESFANGSLLHCSKWYDQSGNGNHAVQTSEANQPRVTDGSGNVLLENGRPRLHFVNGSGVSQTEMFADTNDSLLGLSTLDAYIAYNPNGDTSYILFAGDPSGGGAPYSYVVAQHEDGNTGLQASYNPSGSNGDLYVDGSQVSITYGTTDRLDMYNAVSGTGIQIEVHEGQVTQGTGVSEWETFGISSYGGRGLTDAFISEILLFGEDKSSNRTDLQDNMNNYYYAY